MEIATSRLPISSLSPRPPSTFTSRISWTSSRPMIGPMRLPLRCAGDCSKSDEPAPVENYRCSTARLQDARNTPFQNTESPGGKGRNKRVGRRIDLMDDAPYLQSRTPGPPPSPREARSRMYLQSGLQPSFRLADHHQVNVRAEFKEIVGDSPALTTALDLLSIVAPTDSTVLILGETGTGKELIARAGHALSGRSQRPFVKVNCAAIPVGLLESELFGYERGAFTGAHRRKPGQFEQAHGGTIYLDEIAELPVTLQAKLLHVLQDRRYSPVGRCDFFDVDARVIAATNRDLEEAMARGEFRPDLYYRLDVVEIHVPPLRERPDEIPALA